VSAWKGQKRHAVEILKPAGHNTRFPWGHLRRMAYGINEHDDAVIFNFYIRLEPIELHIDF
jgi:hypothetical protein